MSPSLHVWSVTRITVPHDEPAFRPKGQFVRPAKANGPGTAPQSGEGPTGRRFASSGALCQPTGSIDVRSVGNGTAGPLDLMNSTRSSPRAVGLGWTNECPLGRKRNIHAPSIIAATIAAIASNLVGSLLVRVADRVRDYLACHSTWQPVARETCPHETMVHVRLR